MIGLDAAESELIEAWTGDGTLPRLAGLIRDGAYGRLASTADWLVGSPWPSFYTSTLPSEHGFYHYLAWHPDRMAAARPDPERLPLTPFWRRFGEDGPRTVAIDVPLVYAPEPFHGVEVNGWATHETLVSAASHPPNLLDRIESRHGRSPRVDELYDLLSVDRLLGIRDEQVGITHRLLDVALDLLAREPWDLGIVCFAAAHRAGHKLWDETGTGENSRPDARERLRGGLRDVYRELDAAVGRLVDAAGDASVLVFSVHGMGPNPCRTELLGEMLGRVLAGDAPSADPSPGLVQRLREAVPNEWRHAVKQRLPHALQDRLTAFWRMRGVDWSTAPAVSLVADLQGYVRVNQKGREAEGMIAPGPEKDALCARIADGLATFVDEDTGEPVVREIARIETIYPDGPHRDLLPDLVVRWTETPAALHRAIASPRFGAIPWPTPGRNPSGRSGNHRGEGILVAVGPGFPGGGRIDGGHVIDLAPTACRLLGVETPGAMRGRALAGSRSGEAPSTG